MYYIYEKVQIDTSVNILLVSIMLTVYFCQYKLSCFILLIVVISTDIYVVL
jgi:hypothetical protein